MKDETLALIVSQVAGLIAEARRRDDAFEELQLPRQEVRGDGVRITDEKRRAIRRILGYALDPRGVRDTQHTALTNPPWAQVVAGSNPAAPTNPFIKLRAL